MVIKFLIIPKFPIFDLILDFEISKSVEMSLDIVGITLLFVTSNRIVPTLEQGVDILIFNDDRYVFFDCYASTQNFYSPLFVKLIKDDVARPIISVTIVFAWNNTRNQSLIEGPEMLFCDEISNSSECIAELNVETNNDFFWCGLAYCDGVSERKYFRVDPR